MHIARLKKLGKEFEILVDLDKALFFKKTGQGSVENILAFDGIFSDSKKGLRAASSDLLKAFGTTDVLKIAEEILRHGEIQLPAEYRKKELEQKRKQVIDVIAKSCIDPRTGLPHTPERIASAIDEAGISFTDQPAEQQLPEILKKLRVVLPLKFETKRIEIRIPPEYTGKAYALFHDIKESEEWLDDGSLHCIVALPAAMQSQFYDKLNAITHGNAITREIKEKEKE